LLDTGMGITLDAQVAVFADHCRGIPAASVCSGCGYRFDPADVDGDCPTIRVVRPMLRRRQRERQSALTVLGPGQMAELVKPTQRGTAAPNGQAVCVEDLFDVTPLQHRAGLR